MSQTWDLTLQVDPGAPDTWPNDTTSNRSRLTLLILHADGRTTRWGLDELEAQNVPFELRFSTTNPGGFSELSCSLFRNIDRVKPDESLFDTVLVLDGTRVVWEGRLTGFPRVADESGETVHPSAEGWVAHLGDMRRYRQIFRDIDRSRWQPPGLTRHQNLVAAEFGPPQDGGAALVPDTATPALGLKAPSTWTGAAASIAEAWYDAGGIPLARMYYAWTRSTSLPLSGTDAAWVWTANLSSDDTLTASNASGDLQPASGTTGAGTVTATGTKPWAMVNLYYDYHVAGDYGSAGVDYSLFFTALAVYGNHGLTLRGIEPDAGFYGSDIVAHVLPLTAPLLNFTTGVDGTIEPTTTIIPHLTFLEPVAAEDVVKRCNAAELKDWFVWEGRTFHMRSGDPDRLTWKARLADGAQPALDGLSGADVYTSVIVKFTDPAGKTRTAGPPGSGCDYTDASLELASEDAATNAAAVHGIVRDATLELSDVATNDFAVTVGAIFLTERGQRQRRGQVDIIGEIEHPTAGMMGVQWVRAGDYIDLVDTDDNSLGGARRIVATDMDWPTRTNTLTLDNTAYTLDALLDVLQAELV